MKITCLASGSSGNSYLVKTSTATLLLEAGLSVKALAEKGVKLSDIDLCLITHEHGDHAKYAKQYSSRGVHLMCSEGTADALALPNLWTYRRLMPNQHDRMVWLREYEHPLYITGIPLVHDAAEPMGLIVRDEETSEKLVFITDTAYIPGMIDGMTHLMIECNYSWQILDAHKPISPSHRARVMGSHLDIDSVLEWLQKNDISRLQEIYLMHLSDDHSDEAEFKRAVQASVGVSVWVCLKNGGVI